MHVGVCAKPDSLVRGAALRAFCEGFYLSDSWALELVDVVSAVRMLFMRAFAWFGPVCFAGAGTRCHQGQPHTTSMLFPQRPSHRPQYY